MQSVYTNTDVLCKHTLPPIGTKNDKTEMMGSELCGQNCSTWKAMSHVLGQVSAPSPREMYEADPKGPPNTSLSV